ncbi:hypothetical protein [Aquimarina sp. MMG016]|uniref:hypothetical protein n=1 Tax=Aquimarina sp. MMG016 TaxID=2822690 RepID=UPI001B3A517A|nr:hypothetical protein [Aquimarina sp. MMG016]MBQ4822571.1 hypothetical protein [Aquimarina sp. MMG016]
MDVYSNEFCQMELHDRFVIVTMNENVNLTLTEATILRDKLKKYYNSNHFVMISHRKYKHKVCDQVYKQGQLPNMKGLAIVSSDDKERDRAMIEQQLYGKSFTFFEDLEEAKSWAEGYF